MAEQSTEDNSNDARPLWVILEDDSKALSLSELNANQFYYIASDDTQPLLVIIKDIGNDEFFCLSNPSDTETNYYKITKKDSEYKMELYATSRKTYQGKFEYQSITPPQTYHNVKIYNIIKTADGRIKTAGGNIKTAGGKRKKSMKSKRHAKIIKSRKPRKIVKSRKRTIKNRFRTY